MPCIILADRLYPSDIMYHAARQAFGFVSRYGSVYSHSAILARNLGIPYISQLDSGFDGIKDQSVVMINGQKGEVYVDIDWKTAEALQEKSLKQQEKEETVKIARISVPHGKRIKIMANANRLEDLEAIRKSAAEGIGLVRSEYLFSDDTAYPDEDTQFEIYKKFVTGMAPHPVTIRTFDFSSDKPNRFRCYEKEENPALGYRGIRISLEEPKDFLVQIRALLRASEDGNLRILFPMITGLKEVIAIKMLLLEARKTLKEENMKMARSVPIGLMIETPAAALIADMLAPEVDFFSLGTNDLIQYTLASDRQNARTAGLYDENHPAIKKLIHMTCQAAKKAKIPVAICGEMAENPDYAKMFVSYQVDELSVAVKNIDRLRKLYSSK